MRIKNTLNNAAFSGGSLIITTILNIFYRTIFIKTLGVDYLGLNSALINVIAILSLAELGISQAISFYLYKPLAQRNSNKVYSWIIFFKKLYQIIGILVIILALIALPIIRKLVPINIDFLNFSIIYCLFIASTTISYFFSYKRAVIIADQKNFKIVPIITLNQIIEIIIKIAILYSTKDYIYTLACQLFFRLSENLWVNGYIQKHYANIFNAQEQSLAIGEKKSFFVKLRSLVLHKVGDISINGTDSLIISALVSVAVLGVYSNYLMIISLGTSFILLLFQGSISSFGNLITAQDQEQINKTFKAMQLAAFGIFGVVSICIYFFLSKVITLWIGHEYTLSQESVLIMTVNFLLLGLRVPLNTIKVAAAVYEVDKYAPLLQGAINLVLSIFLAHYYGLNGVLLGTLISSILIPFWVQPYVVYKYIIRESITVHYKTLFKYMIVLCISWAISYFYQQFFDYLLSESSISDNSFLLLFIRACTTGCILLFIFFIAYFRSNEFLFFKTKFIKG